MSASSFFANRTVVIASMHRKEEAIAPLLSAALSVQTLVPEAFNTDAFGTFTREIDRPDDQLATARIKAEAALTVTGETLAVASEGSFGPHPQIPFVACDRELVLLCDRTHQLEIVGESLSTETNYRSQTIHSLEEAFAFAKAAGFPQHGLVVMRTSEPTFKEAPKKAPKEVLAKGITTEADLVAAVKMALAEAESLHIETDMRALYNPMRMKAIAQATQDLIQKINQCCPQCHFPGFTVVQRCPGLPCRCCGAATLLTLSELYACQHCGFQHTQSFPDSLKFADPGQCFYCNP